MSRRLVDLAYGRSGDKIARTPEAYAELKAGLTAARVRAYFGSMVQGEVVRYELDNIGALNFVLHAALDGGATRSLRIDGLGKSLAGILLQMPWNSDGTN
jgi:hypothetical protein